MTKQPKVRKPHPILHGIGLVLSVIVFVLPSFFLKEGSTFRK